MWLPCLPLIVKEEMKGLLEKHLKQSSWLSKPQSRIPGSNSSSTQTIYCFCLEEHIKMLSPSFLSIGRAEQKILSGEPDLTGQWVVCYWDTVNFSPRTAAWMRLWNWRVGASRSSMVTCAPPGRRIIPIGCLSCQEPLLWAPGQCVSTPLVHLKSPASPAFRLMESLPCKNTT